MYAIIQDGGHQYRVEEGTKLKVQLRDSAKDQKVVFDNVCLVGNGADSKVGTPFVAGAKVEATVLRPLVRAKKVIILKYRRRKNSQRRNGHRQNYTEVQISKIHA
jgi:large subunit ribosomal protein L21